MITDPKLRAWEPALLVILAGHLLMVGIVLLWAGASMAGWVLCLASAGISIRAKRTFERELAVWEEEVAAMSAGEMGEAEHETLNMERETLKEEMGGAR